MNSDGSRSTGYADSTPAPTVTSTDTLTAAPLPVRDITTSTYPGSSLYRHPAATVAAPAGHQR